MPTVVVNLMSYATDSAVLHGIDPLLPGTLASHTDQLLLAVDGSLYTTYCGVNVMYALCRKLTHRLFVWCLMSAAGHRHGAQGQPNGDAAPALYVIAFTFVHKSCGWRRATTAPMATTVHVTQTIGL
jgi:hypothetical protein